MVFPVQEVLHQNGFYWYNYIKLKLIDQMNLNEDNKADLGLSAQFISGKPVLQSIL